MSEIATIGYEGRTVDELIQLLTEAAVNVLVDVRLTPLSRKPGMAKNRLAARLREAGIDYIHLPGLGNPRDNRDGFRQGEPQARERYRTVVQSAQGRRSLEQLAAPVSQRVALMCFERNPSECHRSIVVEALIELNPGLVAEHL